MVMNLLLITFAANLMIMFLLFVSSCWLWLRGWRLILTLSVGLNALAPAVFSFLFEGEVPIWIFLGGATGFFFLMYVALLHATLDSNIMQLPNYDEYGHWRIFGNERPERKRVKLLGLIAFMCMVATIVAAGVEQ